MINGRLFSGSMGLGVLVFALLSVSRFAAAQQPLDELSAWVPGDSQLVILAANAAETLRRFDATEPGKTMQLPAWQRYLQALQSARRPSAFHLRPWFGLDWSDLRSTPAPVAFWMVRRSPTAATLVLAIDCRHDPMMAKRLATRAAEYWRESRGTPQVEQSGPRRQTTWRMPTGFAGSPQPALIENGGRLFFLAGPDGAAGFMEDASRSPNGPLAKSAEYQAAMGQAAKSLADAHEIRLWIRPLPLAKGWETKGAPAPNTKTTTKKKSSQVERDWVAAAERQGLGAVQAVGIVGRVHAKPGRVLELALAVPVKRPFTSAMQLASLVPGPWVDPFPAVTADAVGWSIVYQDIQPWFKGFGFLFDEAVDPESPGSFQDVLDGIREDPEGPRITVEKDIIARLVPGATQVRDHGGAKTAENPQGIRVAQRFQAKEGDQLREVFQRYFQGDENVGREVVGDVTIWSTKSGHSLLFETGEEREVTFTSLALGRDYLMLCNDVAWLRQLVKTPAAGKSLKSSPGFQAVAAAIQQRAGANDSYRGYIQLGQDWGKSFERARTGQHPAGAERSVQDRLVEVLFCPGPTAGRAEILRQLPRWSDLPNPWGVSGSAFGLGPAAFQGIWSWLAPSSP